MSTEIVTQVTPVEKFLEFEGKEILFRKIDGQYWVAIKPICQALNVNYNRAYQNIKEDELFNEVFANQQMVGADNKERQMMSLPEYLIYGWLCTLKSKSKDFLNYRKTCYAILYNHFHGTITKRSNILEDSINESNELKKIEEKLKLNEDYKRLLEIKANSSKRNKQLKQLDKDLLSNQRTMSL